MSVRHEYFRKIGPKPAHDPSVGELCPACQVAFQVGDFTTLVPLGPGNDPEQQERCREGRPYNAIAVQCHYACVTGLE